ncbi:MAG: hypothetical protein V8R83_00760 [Candidatus Gastranaerophilaceae bacterium]|jgi:hypothetical protein|uniref:Uncharacterized protein n=1 Tax=Candidatus Limenecus avicola TaxID=2840847 RepID=A0A9D1MZS6_9CLOT|nr:hypothetical protein [Clostridium sp.]CDC21169.1 unknown [Clostridium sp. CAG:306]DAB22491.1 MAG TPA: hypothetical protein CPT85_06125 [Candidatus Gastranaerophilales bacterium HUM_21]HIU92474.1 hypothetical protein [Candidatus Limenecus avicola]
MTLNGITPSFGKTHINSSKMNATQKELSENIIEQTKNTDEFKKADKNNVDLYFLPKGKKSVNVVCVDNDSQQVFKKDRNKRIIHSFSTESFAPEFNVGIKKLLKTLKDINNSEIDKPHIWDHLIGTAKTDVAKMRPEIYKGVKDDVKTYVDKFGYEKDEALETVSTQFIELFEKTNKNDEF